MTMNEAEAALNVPAGTENNNCVIDGQARLREALRLATSCGRNPEVAPSYVVEKVQGLQSWVDHALRSR